MPHRPPPERQATARQRIRDALASGEPLTLKELSARVGLSEKDLPDHLEHLRKSVEAGGADLVVEPAVCSACDFVFEGRTRFRRPGRCPRCRSTRIDPPLVRLEHR